MDKVSAATITQLTTATDFGAPTKTDPAPTAQDILENFRAADPRRCKELERLLSMMPSGFAAVPVLYTRIPRATNARLETEYQFSVRQRFLKFLARQQKPALRALGICDHGIARMARGMDPANAQGQRYVVNVDHIIERCGSGRLSNVRQRDVVRNDPRSETFPVNHFNNLLLVPEDIHEHKNAINTAQNINAMQDGESRWIVMMVPVCDARNPGYVCPPQPLGQTLGRLKTCMPSVHDQIGDGANVGQYALWTMQRLAAETAVGGLLATLDQLADHHRPAHARREKTTHAKARRQADDAYVARPFTVADLDLVQPRAANANENTAISTVSSAPRTLRAIFNAAVSHDPRAAEVLERKLRPALGDLATMVEAAYARVRALEEAAHARNDKGGHFYYKDFVQFFRGRKFRDVCAEAARYPLPEAKALLQATRRIEADITRRNAGFRSHKHLKKTG